MLFVLGAAAHERIVVRQPGRIGDAGNGIRQVVVSVRGVVNRILAGARHAALETDDLRDEAVVLRQHDAAAVQQRQQVAVEVGLGLLRDLVAEAMPAERLLDELAAKMVAGDLGDAIELAERGELVDDSLRRERRARFADDIMTIISSGFGVLCAIARVIESSEPPLGSMKPRYFTSERGPSSW